MAKSKYAELSKEALVEEIKNRRASGRSISVDLRADEKKLRAALETDDLESGDFVPNASDKPATSPATPPEAKKDNNPPPPAPEPKVAPVAVVPGSLRNQVTKAPETPTKPTQPTDEEFSGGSLARHKGDGFTYEVVKFPGDDFNKPVKCRVPAQDSGHPGFYWEGTEEEFAAQFEKV